MKASLLTCDTSVLVPAITTVGTDASRCREVIRQVRQVPAHVLLETYRVLTVLPGAARVPGRTVVRALESLQWEPLTLPAEQYLPLIAEMAEADFGSGAIYDAQIAATAKRHGLKLISRDRRAERSYRLIGVDYEWI